MKRSKLNMFVKTLGYSVTAQSVKLNVNITTFPTDLDSICCRRWTQISDLELLCIEGTHWLS